MGGLAFVMKKRPTKVLYAILSFSFILIMEAGHLVAQVPSLLEYDGFMAGNITGNRKIGVKLYSASKNGTLIYKETIGTLKVTQGQFYFQYGKNGTLGNGTTPTGISAALTGPEQWVAITVNGTEQTPRQRLLSVPFALRSGNSGNTVLSGTMNPATNIGNNGDFYINKVNRTLFGPKTSGIWGNATTLVGAQGPQGLVGGTGPSGATGAQGQVGATGPAGATGAKGDIGATGATGPQGPVGTKGDAGLPGRTILSGEIVPDNTVGADGDFYFNTANRTMYGPKTAGAWGNATTLVGAQGPQGLVGATGPSGATGAQGLAGANGIDGATGPAGATGATGAKGETGATGATGATGPQGAVGATGPQGDKGDSAAALYAPYVEGAPVTQASPVAQFQGSVLEQGQPVNGNRTFTFKIYDTAVGGTELYSESIGVVAVSNGVYSFEYGSGIGSSLAASTPTSSWWVEITMNGTVQIPRQKILSVPYALKAKTSEDAQELASNFTNLQIQTGGLSSNLTTLQGTTGGLSSNITTLQSQNTALSSNITALQGQTAGVSTNITALRQDLGTLGILEPVVLTTLAGSGNGAFGDGTGVGASFNAPNSVAVDVNGTVYVADQFNHRIRKVTSAGVVTTLAGNGTAGFVNGNGTTAQFNNPIGIAVDGSGNVYVADAENHRVRKITSSGVVTTLAGSGTAGFANGNGTSASFAVPLDVAVDESGNVYVADLQNNRIRKITSAGVVTTLAGSGNGTFVDGNATTASFSGPNGVAVDGSGNVYVADAGNQRIRKVTSAGVVTTLAGNGAAGYADGSGSTAMFNVPCGIAIDMNGNLYVTDGSNNRIRKVTPGGVVTTLAGSESAGFADGTGTVAMFNNPGGVAVDASGVIYVGDSWNHRIRKMQTQIQSLTTGLNSVQGQASGLSSNFTTLQAQTGGLSSNLTTLQGQVNTLSGNVTVLASGQNTLTANVTTLGGQVNALSGNVSALASGQNNKLEALEAMIQALMRELEAAGALKMIPVVGGTLPAGSTLANQTVTTFQIAQCETTWGEWKTVRTWAAANGYDIGALGSGIDDNYPVIDVQWYDVVKWCNAKSEMEGLAPVYSYNGTVLRTGGWQILGSSATDNIVNDANKNGYRLPTIREWEWAARGGISTKGYTYSGGNDVDLVAWYSSNSGNATHAVATKAPNELGIYDMSGNATEWCWDRGGIGRYARGGTWNSLSSEWLANSQLGTWLPSVGNFFNDSGDFGFRLARNFGN